MGHDRRSYRRAVRPLLTLLVVVGAMLALAAPAHAAFPGANGKIVFVNTGGIYSINPDGSAVTSPTLLIDEIDTIFTARSERAEALRGVLNAGNRHGAVVVRGTAEGEPATFSTFCAKVLAGIDTGKLPDTIRDRAIVIDMERKLRSEKVPRGGGRGSIP